MWMFVWLAALVGFCVWRWVQWLDSRDEAWLEAEIEGGIVVEMDWLEWEIEMIGG
ncbi:hypothetical protein LCGC14_1875220 [marine sediment metagenome]|uniref:Uncharacterized protein n=1 Tax=marine sediment metagenome TaxID=412755 RepID=A0A0F9GRZ0_9ZZZZ